ncbi:MAG: ABC transporter substrate-binding protein [Candidatus Methanomethylophilaceae archaeon]|nr:ABC transporter substrate-binding protein [Candidatus Methanomethylophilaceae archaeon]
MKEEHAPMTAERIFQLKSRFTFAIIIIGVIIAVVFAVNTTEATQDHATGILIDFEEYDVTWFETDLNVNKDPINLLKNACEENLYPLTIDSKGTVIEINGISNDADRTWGLWYVENGGSTEWVKSESYEIDASQYAIIAWAFRAEGDKPTVAVDLTGVCFFGYGQSHRVITLSPVATETVYSLNAGNIIVGTDYYSNYPDDVNNRKRTGEVTVTGTYTDPNYEIVVKLNPDLIVGDGSQFNQIQLCKTARSSFNSVVLYPGEDIHTIFDNTYIASVAIGYDLAFDMVYQNDTEALDEIDRALTSIPHSEKKVMVALSTDVAPYVGGSETYIDDMLTTVYVSNAFSSVDGWSHISTEMIALYNPDIIIVVTDQYEATQSEWDIMYSHLYDTWKATDAYKSGEIYLLTGASTDLASRASPRFPQIVEILGEICYPEAFKLESMPKYLGDNYLDYLVYTKYLGYN